MNLYLVVILAVITLHYAIHVAVDILNLRHIRPALPPEFEGWYDAQEYRRAQTYLRDQTSLGICEDTVFTILGLVMIIAGGFNTLDIVIRRVSDAPLVQGLLFIGTLILGLRLLSLPFAVFRTFVLEAKYGFNRTTVATFISDNIKGLVLTALLGGAALAAVLWFFLHAGLWAWIYCWLAISAFQLFLTFIAPVVIMPLFNRYTPLPEGPLKAEIEAYAQGQRFALQGIFTMDGSRRSRKANAFFSGVGRFRRIALFDTLIKNHSREELVAILAHEIGHYTQGHIVKRVALSLATDGVMFYLLSRFLYNEGLFAAFGMEHISVYASFVFFGFLYTPVRLLFDIIAHGVSRRHEFAADRFSVQTYPHPDAFVSALKKLSVHNLSNLTPHPAKVFLAYSHPPVLQRLAAIRHQAGAAVSSG